MPKEILDGIELYSPGGVRVGVIYFDSGHLYIASGAMPIVIKNIHPDMIMQIGDFFYYYGKNPEVCVKRIDFPDLTIRIEKNIIYFISNINLVWDLPGLSELKKAGTWLRKHK